MAKKKANPFLLTVAGIAAATVIGAAGVALTPAPHVIFSLAPSTEPEATPAPEPVGAVLADPALEAVTFADPDAVEYIPLLDTDSESLSARYGLPALERMTESDTQSLIEPLQVIQRIQALGIAPAAFDTPEANWKNLYNSVMTKLAPLATAETAQTVTFSGSGLAELNDFLAANAGCTVEVNSPALAMDATLLVPSNTVLHGNGVVLVPGAELLDKAIVLDSADSTAVTGFVINGGCNYGIYVKNSTNFYLAGNDISNVSLKGLCIMGDNSDFVLSENSLHENQNGAIFLNGDIHDGIIEGNRIENNYGARNLTAGLVLCSMPIEDIETAYNPFPDEMLYDIQQSPNRLVVRGNTVAQNHSSGIYSESGYLNYYIENTIYKNEKEGMCLDYGSFGNYITGCEIRQNGGRNRMSDEDLEADFILDQGRMEDGSSPAKLPGISLDNTAYNTIYGNIVRDNYGSGIKAVRSAFSNTILCNQIIDNNQGVSEKFHFFGVELSTDLNADEAVQGLDFTPCYENIIARNTISGQHFAGVFLGENAFMNDVFDNTMMDGSDWAIESLSEKYNPTLNNMANRPTRGIDLSNAQG